MLPTACLGTSAPHRQAWWLVLSEGKGHPTASDPERPLPLGSLLPTERVGAGWSLQSPGCEGRESHTPACPGRQEEIRLMSFSLVNKSK